MKHKLLLIYSWFIRTILYFFPDMPIIMRFRGFLYGLGMKKAGRNFHVTNDVFIKGLEQISVGDDVIIGNHCIMLASSTLNIGDQVLIAPNVVIVTGNHSFANGSYRFGKAVRGDINIGKGSWIAANCTVAANSCLPAGSVLAANSFLNGLFSIKYAIYGGTPAKFIKQNIDTKVL